MTGGTGGAAGAAGSTGEIDIATLKKYISYARTKVAPRLTPEAATALQAAYVQIRQGARQRESDARAAALASSEDHGVIPITVRQLEALVRLTEAVAKATLSVEANEAHVQVRALRWEAHRLAGRDAACLHPPRAGGLAPVQGVDAQRGSVGAQHARVIDGR